MGATAGTSNGCPQSGVQAPVVVLTMARSGSTLLRFILDTHPDLACPPEACLGSACFMLARLWDVLEPSPHSAGEGFQPFRMPTELAGTARASIRGVIDDVYGRYLARYGKRRWCDKSLDNIGIAELLADIYPDAQFICLYRHCLDVIASAVEACPWGLSGYGFEQYSACNPGNAVAAVASCWLDRTTPIIEFQQQHPDRCHGIRYEDLVTQPEQVAESLFDFLSVRQAPGITRTCFTADHDVRGPGDHKIWFTGRISQDSIGRGVTVPTGMIPPELLARINPALAQLEYRQVDDSWPAGSQLLDPRADCQPGTAGCQDVDHPDAQTETAATELASRLAAAAARPATDLAGWRPDGTGRRMTLLILPASRSDPVPGWTLSLDAAGLTVHRATAPDPAATVATATAATWLAILAGHANPATEWRAGRLRLTAPPVTDEQSPPQARADIRLLGRLLGIAPATLPGTPGFGLTERSVLAGAVR